MERSRATHRTKAAAPPKRARPTNPAEARYSIRVTSRLTSIELDTLRMWERRYGFPSPERTESGSRVYSDTDVDTLKLIVRALDQGYRPGEVVGKSSEELMKLVLVTSSGRASPRPSRPSHEPADGSPPTIPSLLAAIARDDLRALQAELHQAAVLLGPKRFVVDVAQPLSTRVGELWAAGQLEVLHEHLLTECLSAQLRVLRSVYEDKAGSARVVLSSLPNERHGLGLEMVAVYLAVRQVTPILLGVDTPPEQIVKTARSQSADAVGLLVTGASDLPETSKHIRWMLRELPRRTAIWVGGGGGPALKIRDDALRVVATWADLDASIDSLSRRPS